MFYEQLINGITQGAFYAMFAAGLTLIFGVMRIINMAHGGIFMWGAFISWFIITRLDLPFLVCVAIAAFISGCMGLVLDKFIFAPLRKRDSSYLQPLVTSLGASVILINLAEKIFGTRVVRYPFEKIPLSGTVNLLGVEISGLQISLLVSALLIMGCLWFLVNKTKIGIQIRAIEENPRFSRMLGINVEKNLKIVFYVACSMAGIAGLFIGLAYNYVSPYMGQAVALKGYCIIILAGLGSIPGAILGGFILGFFEVLTVVALSSSYKDVGAYILLLLILAAKPAGLFGSSEEARS